MSLKEYFIISQVLCLSVSC